MLRLCLPSHLQVDAEIDPDEQFFWELNGFLSHWRDYCHFVDALSPSLLKHLLKVEGGAAA